MWKLPTVWCCGRAECKEGCERETGRSQLEALDEFHVAGESLRKSSGAQQREGESSSLAVFLSLCPAGDLDCFGEEPTAPRLPSNLRASSRVLAGPPAERSRQRCSRPQCMVIFLIVSACQLPWNIWRESLFAEFYHMSILPDWFSSLFLKKKKECFPQIKSI